MGQRLPGQQLKELLLVLLELLPHLLQRAQLMQSHAGYGQMPYWISSSLFGQLGPCENYHAMRISPCVVF